ncbi:MAG: ACP S-malonyltransferase [Chloroflexia bacterium]|nr:ACP S-malonyltransferase [Chloroflexia bacterium]
MPSNRTAYLFPGQGSQHVGMGRDLARTESVARRLWEEADQTLGFALSTLAFEGPADQLQATENAQPALLVASIATLRVLTGRGVLGAPAFLAGHSLGEYSALVAAQSLTFADALRLVRTRGALMAAAGKCVDGAMAAVMGLAPEEVAAACAAEGVDVANYNSLEQTVISGEAAAVGRAVERVKQAGARRVVPLAVSGAFHSRLMRPLAEEFAGAMKDVAIAEPKMPVVCNVSATPLTSADAVRRELVEQLYSPVSWVRTLEFLRDASVGRYVEIGPGNVLAGLAKRTLPGATVATSDGLLTAVGG